MDIGGVDEFQVTLAHNIDLAKTDIRSSGVG